MHRILALLLTIGSMATAHNAFADSSSYSILPGNYNLIGFDSQKHYVVLDNNKIFKVLDSQSAAIVARWTIGTSIRLFFNDKSRMYVLVNTTTGESVPMKHKHHLPEGSTE